MLDTDQKAEVLEWLDDHDDLPGWLIHMQDQLRAELADEIDDVRGVC